MANDVAKAKKQAGPEGIVSGTQANLLSGKKVLICDDSASQRARLRELYETLGFACVGEASHGLECLIQAEKSDPDLISLDILMPEMHGVETLDHLRRANSRAIIVFVSAIGAFKSVSELKIQGAAPDAVFSKKDPREMFLDVLFQLFLSKSLGQKPEEIPGALETAVGVG